MAGIGSLPWASSPSWSCAAPAGVVCGAAWSPYWPRVSMVTQAWLGIETGLEVLTGSDLHPPGILQRVSVLLVCLMLATLLPGLRASFLR